MWTVTSPCASAFSTLPPSKLAALACSANLSLSVVVAPDSLPNGTGYTFLSKATEPVFALMLAPAPTALLRSSHLMHL